MMNDFRIVNARGHQKWNGHDCQDSSHPTLPSGAIRILATIPSRGRLFASSIEKVECVELSTPLVSNEALGFYDEKKDEQRDVGLGPSQDWSSHGADAFGLMAISWDSPRRLAAFRKPIVFPKFNCLVLQPLPELRARHASFSA
jgi:hypothetical protein